MSGGSEGEVLERFRTLAQSLRRSAERYQERAREVDDVFYAGYLEGKAGAQRSVAREILDVIEVFDIARECVETEP